MLAVLTAGLLLVPACNQGALGYPGVFNGSAGSCTYPETGGYVACEDYLGSDYSSQVGQSLCANVTIGTWSGDACSTANALGSCLVAPIGTGDSQTVRYTYYASTDPDSGITADALTAQTACGLLGGTFISQ
ncbi:MAG TPA: hypothetical protein VMB50_04455 [Myxococcales bacterium]|nr:hypothetical protein [Myxococcales bacterium]